MRPLPAVALAPLLLLGPPAAAELTLTRTGGVLGESVTYDLAGDPGELYFLIPSAEAGPLPLTILNPGDTRVLEVGLDLPFLWRSGALDGAGQASWTFPLPSHPVLVGLGLHAQAITIPGSPFLVDDLSNPTSVVVAHAGEVTAAIGERVVPTNDHGQTLLADGRVLLSGGTLETASGPGAAVDSLEVFDPQTQRFAALAAVLTHPRAHHAAVQLADGRVLLVGGVDDTGVVVATADLYDPATGQVVAAASMAEPRALHTATLLPDGRVLVVGGTTSYAEDAVFTTSADAVSSTELYDPTLDAWTPGPPLPARLSGHAAALLPSGRVLVAGGVEARTLFGFPLLTWTAAAHLVDPLQAKVLAAAALPSGRSRAAALPTAAGALLTGGETALGLSWTFLDETLAYDEASDAWTPAGALTTPRSRHALVDAGTRLVVVGGIRDVDPVTALGIGEPAIDTAPPDASAWTAAEPLALARRGGRATAIEGGERVLVTGTGEAAPAPPDAGVEVLVTP